MVHDIEYLTSNRLIRYPFSDDSKIQGVSDSLSLNVFGCFVDALVQYSDNTSITPYVTGIRLDGHTLKFTLVCGSNREELSCTRTAERFTVIQTPKDSTVSWGWYVFVISNDGIRDFEENKDSIEDISGVRITLSVHCIGNHASDVRRLLVYSGTGIDPTTGVRYKLSDAILSSPDWEVTGDVKLLPGNNIRYTGASVGWDTSDTGNRISINAIPGAGQGRIAGTEIKESIQPAMPDLFTGDGNVRLLNDLCYDIVPRRLSERDSEIEMHVKCKACCTCDMYADIVNKRLVPLKDSLLETRDSLNETLAKYEENVEKWNYRLTHVQPVDIVMTVAGVPLDAAATDIKGGGIVGCMNRCGYSLMIRNDAFVDVRIDLSEFRSNGLAFESQVSYIGKDELPEIIKVDLNNLDICSITLPPGRSATLTYFIRLRSMVSTDMQSGFMSSIRVSAYQEDRLIVSQTKDLSI